MAMTLKGCLGIFSLSAEGCEVKQKTLVNISQYRMIIDLYEIVQRNSFWKYGHSFN